jgi:CheY-like chemotaxis protein
MPLRILVAEDNQINQKMIVSLLRTLGYEADAVSNGDEAVHAASVRDYDVILMDVHMPETDGITATKLIRERSTPGRPAIVAVTADTTREARAACHAAGMDGFVTKPVKIAELAAALESVASRLRGAA